MPYFVNSMRHFSITDNLIMDLSTQLEYLMRIYTMHTYVQYVWRNEYSLKIQKHCIAHRIYASIFTQSRFHLIPGSVVCIYIRVCKYVCPAGVPARWGSFNETLVHYYLSQMKSLYITFHAQLLSVCTYVCVFLFLYFFFFYSNSV